MTPHDDPMPDSVLQNVLAVLEPHRDRLEPLLRAAAEAETDQVGPTLAS
ncbi:hypothetical protein [Streptosporangium jomthongense]|uniref:Uncharacterized protein n=1 Tax=Streptosporangium jomthongense TaxID=1193683 RepID=A0ABV8FGM2_9ACTN